jgi:hypothetical protein
MEIARYDAFHGYVHRDMLNRDRDKVRTVNFGSLDRNAGLTAAIAEFNTHFESYVRRCTVNRQTVPQRGNDDVQDIIDYILAQGGHAITAEEKRTPEWREEYRSILRILASDDTRIPEPNEEEELERECGPVMDSEEAKSGK